jgi:ankyrin repeat protein
LIYSASNGYADIVRVLIENGTQINATDSYGWTPLMSAVYGGHKEIVQTLIKKGANVNAKNKLDKSIMDVAKYKAQPEIIQGIPTESTIDITWECPVKSST